MAASRPGESSFHPALLASDPASAADGGGAAASATPSTATAAVEVASRASYTGVAPAATPTAAVDGADSDGPRGHSEAAWSTILIRAGPYEAHGAAPGYDPAAHE